MTTRTQIRYALAAGPCTTLELAVRLDLHRDTVRRALWLLARDGRVRRIGARCRSVWVAA